MQQHYKAKRHYIYYLTRKDFHAKNRYRFGAPYGVLKQQRKVAAKKLRLCKGDVSNGGWYKKYSEVMWIVW